MRDLSGKFADPTTDHVYAKSKYQWGETRFNCFLIVVEEAAGHPIRQI
jgi:hypothetical protein